MRGGRPGRLAWVLPALAAVSILGAPRPARAATPALVPAVGLRLGLATTARGTGDAGVAPSLGVEGDLAVGRHLEVHLAWDLAFVTGGTSVVSVSSVDHGLSLLADGRLGLGHGVAVAAGLGPGLGVAVTTVHAGATRTTGVTVLPGVAWEAMLELDAGRFGVRLGVRGRADRSGWPVSGVLCLRLRLGRAGDARR